MEDPVGYGNPPKASQFSSDNQPAHPGRKPGPITQFLHEFGEVSDLIFTIEKLDKKGDFSVATSRLSTGSMMTINQAIAARLLQMALGGDLKAIREVLNRTEGRVPQPIDLGGQADNPLVIDDISKLSTDELRNRRAALRKRIADEATGNEGL